MKMRPLQDRVIIKRVKEEERTKGGLIIPDTAKEKPIEGVVVAVGNGKVDDLDADALELYARSASACSAVPYPLCIPNP